MTDPVNRPVRLAGLAGVMALGLVLAGCSGDGGAGESSSAAPSATSVSSESASPDGSSSASPSASPSGTYEPATETSPAKNVPVPEMPEAAKEPTQEGLEAAVEYWWETDAYLKSTGESDPMGKISTNGCKLCIGQFSMWEEIYEAGGWAVTEGTNVDLGTAEMAPDDAGGTFVAQVTELPVHIHKPDGTLVEEASSREESMANWAGSATFESESGHWKISSMEVMK